MTKSEKILHKHFIGNTNRNFYILIVIVVTTFGSCIHSLIHHSSSSGRHLFSLPAQVVFAVITTVILIAFFALFMKMLHILYTEHCKALAGYNEHHFLTDYTENQLLQSIKDLERRKKEQEDAISTLRAESDHLGDKCKASIAKLEFQIRDIENQMNKVNYSSRLIAIPDYPFASHQNPRPTQVGAFVSQSPYLQN